jgi:hypothetical protein
MNPLRWWSLTRANREPRDASPGGRDCLGAVAGRLWFTGVGAKRARRRKLGIGRCWLQAVARLSCPLPSYYGSLARFCDNDERVQVRDRTHRRGRERGQI